MLPIVAILIFCAKVTILALVLSRLGVQALSSGSLPLNIPPSAWGRAGVGLAATALSVVVFLIDEAYLYPRYRSPLRHLPTVKSGYDARLFVESPRGKTPLRWMKADPDANLILSVGKLGQQVLYPVSPDALKDLLYTNAYDFVKPIGLRAYLSKIIGFSLITTEGATHSRFRKTLAPTFNIKYIRALYQIMWQKAYIFLDRLQEELDVSGKIEMTGWASRYSLDVIGAAALSHEFNGLNSTAHHPVAKAYSTILEPEFYLVKYLFMTIAFSPTLMNLLPFKARRVMDRESGTIREAAEEILDKKRADMAKKLEKEKEVTEERNILGRLLADMDLPREEILDHMLTFIAAGHDTSSASITWACHLLTLPENLHYQDRLREEIRKGIPAEGDIVDTNTSEASLQAAFETLPYLHGVCEETLRLYPPVPATMREAIRDTSILGTKVPKGTMCIVMSYAINRNPRFWGSDADKMLPERWMDKLPDGTLRINKHGGVESNYCEETFLHGPRACIGRDFAKAELKCALAAIFGRYQVRRLEGDDGFVRPKGAVTVKPKNGLHLTMTPVTGW